MTEGSGGADRSHTHRNPRAKATVSPARTSNTASSPAVLPLKSTETSQQTSNAECDGLKRHDQDENLDTETLEGTTMAPLKEDVDNRHNDVSGDIRISNGNPSTPTHDKSKSGQWTAEMDKTEDTKHGYKCACGSGEKCLQFLREQHIKEKIVFVISLVSMLVLVVSLLQVQWFLPYYYAISLPILIILRFVQYFKLKYQYFLLDFCYFGNLFCYTVMWACPQNGTVFMVMFAVANGPLMSAILPYRNSLVFHDYDKLTSVYIHVIPAFVSFCIRWYPTATSTHWYRPFVLQHENPSFIWLVGVPLGGFTAHLIFYHLLVRVCIRPKGDFLDSFSYLVSKNDGVIAKMCRCCGEKGEFWLFGFYLVAYCLGSLLFVRLWYEYFIAHCVFLGIVSIVLIWNGGSFYLDVFGKKPVKDEASNEQAI